MNIYDNNNKFTLFSTNNNVYILRNDSIFKVQKPKSNEMYVEYDGWDSSCLMCLKKQHKILNICSRNRLRFISVRFSYVRNDKIDDISIDILTPTATYTRTTHIQKT